MPPVPQTSVIFFALLVGFVVFITLKGQLQQYLAVIGLEGSGTTLPTRAGISVPGTGLTVQTN